MQKKVQDAIREQHWFAPGDRLGVAVSGGADSVALLRVLDALRADLGLVLTVLHFHHGIRGEDADRDEAFVTALAKKLSLACVVGRGNAPAHAKSSRQSLETAARELRYQFFTSVLESKTVDKIATAHTMDDQAETVLMRLLRGAGTRGLAGIHAVKEEGRIVRPLLGFRRTEIEKYLKESKSEWREDESNRDPKHFRNQVRHQLIALLEREFNPNIVEVLARTADVARAEEDFWTTEVERLLPLLLLPGKPTRGGGRKSAHHEERALSLESLRKQPLALQRRLLVATMRILEIEPEVLHVDTVIDVLHEKTKATELPNGWRVARGPRELHFERSPAKAKKIGDT